MKQLTVLADNKVGSMASILRELAHHQINIKGISTERGNLSEIRLILDDPENAKEILEKINYTSHLVEVIVIELDNNPGELSKITDIISTNKINIEYIYGIDNNNSATGLFAIHTSESTDKLKLLLKDFNLK
ncbi:MAG: ACT domain-containing protein [Candidatus Heimdallarchaeota archaeon]|nr:ACT domain-containing protein [Candidatus Heimdallarchaeota archaeon]